MLSWMDSSFLTQYLAIVEVHCNLFHEVQYSENISLHHFFPDLPTNPSTWILCYLSTHLSYFIYNTYPH
uniref:Uncharacterized protein n=1 Tax=Octopus bimaculoides TaxID=37653 RepID=A0A0L8FUM8_OCTBM